MTLGADYTNTIAGIILNEIYKKHKDRPNDLSEQVRLLFANALTELEIEDVNSDSLLKLVLDAVTIFTENTEWTDFHEMLTGEYASLINGPVMLTKRISAIT